MSLSEQIKRDIERRLKKIDLAFVAQNSAQLMDKIKNENTKQYKSPAVNGRYDKPYNRKYAKRKGVSPNAVDMRSPGSRSIERTKIRATKASDNSSARAYIAFRDKPKGVIFNLHQTGEAKGGKVRQIYPKGQKQVPKEITELTIRTITAEIMRQT